MRKRIWIPEQRQPKPINIKLPGPGLGGIVYLELIDAKTGKVKESHEFTNLITNNLMDGLGFGFFNLGDWRNDSVTDFGVGTGSATPAFTDPTLSFQLNPLSSDNGGFSAEQGFITGSGYPSDKSGSYHYRRLTRVWTETEATGTIAEFGVFNNATPATLGVRSLIKDITGSPITITKTDQDQLRITHEMRLYPPVEADEVTGSIVIGATSYSFSASALNIDNETVWGWTEAASIGVAAGLGFWTLEAWAAKSASGLIDVTGTLQNFNGGVTPAASDEDNSSSLFSYPGSGSFYREGIAQWNPARANGDIKGFAFQLETFAADSTYQIVISPDIVKTDVQRLKLSFHMNFNRAVLDA
jgi:hypothetical protein